MWTIKDIAWLFPQERGHDFIIGISMPQAFLPLFKSSVLLHAPGVVGLTTIFHF